MRITEVATIKLRYAMETPMADAIHLHAGADGAVWSRSQPTTGIVGLGECAAYGGSLDSMERVILDDLRPTLLGEDPFHVERLWSRMARRSHQRGRRGMLMQAISGVDIALWDIIGQATQTPLYRLLGGYRDTLDAYASAGFYAATRDRRDLADEVGGYAERGFRTREDQDWPQPGRHAQPAAGHVGARLCDGHAEEDVERVRAARAALGPRRAPRHRRQQCLDRRRRDSVHAAVADQDIAWLEEPVATDDLAGQRGGGARARRSDRWLRD